MKLTRGALHVAAAHDVRITSESRSGREAGSTHSLHWRRAGVAGKSDFARNPRVPAGTRVHENSVHSSRATNDSVQVVQGRAEAQHRHQSRHHQRLACNEIDARHHEFIGRAFDDVHSV